MKYRYAIPIYIEINGERRYVTRHVTLPVESGSRAIARVIAREVAALKRKGIWGSAKSAYVGVAR